MPAVGPRAIRRVSRRPRGPGVRRCCPGRSVAGGRRASSSSRPWGQGPWPESTLMWPAAPTFRQAAPVVGPVGGGRQAHPGIVGAGHDQAGMPRGGRNCVGDAVLLLLAQACRREALRVGRGDQHQPGDALRTPGGAPPMPGSRSCGPPPAPGRAPCRCCGPPRRPSRRAPGVPSRCHRPAGPGARGPAASSASGSGRCRESRER
jgi:hypothetical protein